MNLIHNFPDHSFSSTTSRAFVNNTLGEAKVRVRTNPPLFHHKRGVKMQSSKPIPISPCKIDPRADAETAREAKMYEAATWRMYELISARRRALAAANLYHYKLDPQQHHENDHASSASTSQQDDDTRRDRAQSPAEPEPPSAHLSSSLLDEVFIMD